MIELAKLTTVVVSASSTWKSRMIAPFGVIMTETREKPCSKTKLMAWFLLFTMVATFHAPITEALTTDELLDELQERAFLCFPPAEVRQFQV